MFDSDEADDTPYAVKIKGFEGPLDLLLRLIKDNEINLYDIPIALITQQYLEAIGQMESLNLTVAGEFLVMAATLIHIKSKMLLPVSETEEAVEEEDPRANLVAQLLEYQKFKHAAEHLEDRERLWRDIFSRSPPPRVEVEEEIPLTALSLNDLLDALKGVMARIPEASVMEITEEALSVKDRMQFILERVEVEESLLFEQLFAEVATRYVVVVTFWALLEMIRLGLVRILQTEMGGPIRLLRTPGGD
jgi:segregation and condensation protein A